MVRVLCKRFQAACGVRVAVSPWGLEVKVSCKHVRLYCLGILE